MLLPFVKISNQLREIFRKVIEDVIFLKSEFLIEKQVLHFRKAKAIFIFWGNSVALKHLLAK